MALSTPLKRSALPESFEISKQFWAYLIQQHIIQSPQTFIRRIPHMSFVWGDENVAYLKKRYDALQAYHLFQGMQYSEDPAQLAVWMPLIMEGRDLAEPLAATRMDIGTDVNFGALTRDIFHYLKKTDGVTLHFNYDVVDLRSGFRFIVERASKRSNSRKIKRSTNKICLHRGRRRVAAIAAAIKHSGR